MLSSLNPYFNGRYSQRHQRLVILYLIACLNPCCNGRYSQRGFFKPESYTKDVLILVLMEDTLRVSSSDTKVVFDHGLNPCFNGRYSQRMGNLIKGAELGS